MLKGEVLASRGCHGATPTGTGGNPLWWCWKGTCPARPLFSTDCLFLCPQVLCMHCLSTSVSLSFSIPLSLCLSVCVCLSLPLLGYQLQRHRAHSNIFYGLLKLNYLLKRPVSTVVVRVRSSRAVWRNTVKWRTGTRIPVLSTWHFQSVDLWSRLCCMAVTGILMVVKL